MTHPLAALIAGVPRQPSGNSDPHKVYLLEADVLAALESATPPDLVEAGKVVGQLRGGINNMPLTTLGGVMHGEPCLAAADLITALIALATAQAAQIAEKQRTYDDLYADALADAKSDAQDFDSDLWIEVRKFLTELHLDWRDYADDGITADQAIEYIRECMNEETRRAEAAEAHIAALTARVERLTGASQRIADGNPTVDSPEADAQNSAVIARAALSATTEEGE